MKNTIVYLIGFPGTGKYTVAKEIVRQGNFKLVDNHLINNLLFTIIKADGMTKLPERIWKSVGEIRDVILDTMIHISPPEYSFVLTNVLLEGKAEDRMWYDKIEKVAQARRALYVPVRLLCSVGEHEKRIATPERAARFKEINPASPSRYANDEEVLKISHPNTMTLDISDIDPAEAAEKILNHAKACDGEPSPEARLAHQRWDPMSKPARSQANEPARRAVKKMWARMTDAEKSVEMTRRAEVRKENQRRRALGLPLKPRK